MTYSNKALSDRDKRVIWHPFTQMKTAAPAIPFVRGKAAELFDAEGNAYLDAIASWWMNTHGHAHPYLAKAVAAQANTLEHAIFADFTHPPAIELAERLLGKLPDNQSKVFYSDNGSTSVEVGIKMCFQYWYNIGEKRTTLIAFNDAYHGDTFGAMSVSGRSAFSAPFLPFLFDVEFIDPPIKGKEDDSFAQLEHILEEKDVAGFIFEPLIMGSGGMLMYAPVHLDRMLDLCKQKDVICIADEVMVGFGRTGRFFASDYLTNKADIFCLSKGLTAGSIALGATTCTEKIFDAFYSDDKMKTLFHGHSCTGNPLACSIGLASMDLMEEEETWENIHRIVNRHEGFAKVLADYTIAENIRQTGVVLAFDVVNNDDTSYFNSLRDQIWAFFLERKIILRPLGNTIYIFPPYCITDEQLDKVYKAITDFLDSKM